VSYERDNPCQAQSSRAGLLQPPHEAGVSSRFETLGAPIEKEREVPMQFGYVVGAVSKLEAQIAALNDRLTPCLRASSPRPTAAATAEPNVQTTIGESLAHVRRRLDRMIEDVTDLTARVEL